MCELEDVERLEDREQTFLHSYPVIVIDVPLYSVSYTTDKNELQLNEVLVGNLHWKYMLAGRAKFGVYIVTKQALPNFLAKCMESADWLLNQNSDELNKVVQSVDEA